MRARVCVCCLFSLIRIIRYSFVLGRLNSSLPLTAASYHDRNSPNSGSISSGGSGSSGNVRSRSGGWGGISGSGVADGSSSSRSRGIGGTGRENSDNDDIVSLSSRDSPTSLDVDRACLRLATDFTVGTTEQMDSFLVLIALENGSLATR